MEILRSWLRRKSSSGEAVRWSSHAAPSTWQALALSPMAVWGGGALIAMLLFLFGAFVGLAPVFGSVLFGLLLFLVVLIKYVASFAPGAPYWAKGMVLVSMGLFVLNLGFAGIAFPMGSLPLPLTDVVLAFALLMSLSKVLLDSKRTIRLPAGIVVLSLWVVFTLALHLPEDWQSFGTAAARDGVRVAEALVVIPAYVMARMALQRPEQGMVWVRSVLWSLGLGLGIYGLMIPFQDVMMRYSPGFMGLQKWVPVLGNYQTWPMAGLVGILSMLAWRWAYARPLSTLQKLVCLLVALGGLTAFAMLQSRAGYVFVAAALLVMSVLGGQGKLVRSALGLLLVCAMGLLVLEMSGLQLKGRVGTLSLTGVADHLHSLTGESRNEEFAGAAGGISQRKAWRAYSLKLWDYSMSSRLLGIGYGRVLTDLTTTGEDGKEVAVQDPHNSYVTTLTRAGVIGFAVMMGVQIWICYVAVVGYRRNRHTDRRWAAFYLSLCMFQIYTLLDAWGEPHFEVTHYIVPTYFVYGVAWAIWQWQQSAFDKDKRARRRAVYVARRVA